MGTHLPCAFLKDVVHLLEFWVFFFFEYILDSSPISDKIFYEMITAVCLVNIYYLVKDVKFR